MKNLLLLVTLFLTSNVFAYGEDLLGDYVKERNQRFAQDEYQRQQADAQQQMAFMENNRMRAEAMSNNSHYDSSRSHNGWLD